MYQWWWTTGGNTCLEIINLLSIGIASANVKQQVPTDLPKHGQVIPAENLKSQDWLEQINDWTKSQKMLINEKQAGAELSQAQPKLDLV